MVYGVNEVLAVNEFKTMHPNIEYYMNRDKDGCEGRVRPHIMNIIEGGMYDPIAQFECSTEVPIDNTRSKGYDFGWIEGVFIRCTLSIFGVLMFLRLNWMFANAGVGGALGVIFWSVCVTTLTTFSLSALSTNGIIKGGGVYYMVSRALGPEFGGVVGLTLFIAQSAAVSLHLNGFGEAVAILENGNYVFDKNGDKIFFGCVGLIFCLCSAFLGANFEVQSQKVLAVSMALALVTFYAGTFASTYDADIQSTPLSSSTFSANLSGSYSKGESWLTVFGVFFPACTGISAGSSISGDLKDPQEAIPKGTFAAILLTTVIYVSMGLLMCACFTPEGLREIKTQISAIDISVLPELMYLGMFAAALSSALALIVGAPRVLQAVARDDILPISFYKKSYFAQEEPLRGYCTVVFVAFICIVALDLNTVSPIVTNFYLVQYGLMNYSVFHAHISKAPGWRPSFSYNNPWLSLLGAIMCLVSMFMVDWILAIVTILASVGIFQYIQYIKPNVSWGDSGVAKSQKQAVDAIYEMERLKNHVKNFRPQFLLMTDDVKEHMGMMLYLSRLKKTRGISLIGKVIVGDFHNKNTFTQYQQARSEHVLVDDEIVGILQVVVASSLVNGVQQLLQLSGFGKLKPNTVLYGFKTNWKACCDSKGEKQLLTYIEMLRAGFQQNYAVGILRHYDSTLHSENAVTKPVGGRTDILGNILPQNENDVTVTATIDVWWLIEDGGLTLLLAYLMGRHADYRRSGTHMRLMGLISRDSSPDDIINERHRLEKLVKSFRFDMEVVLVEDDTVPSDDKVKTFVELAGEKEINSFTRSILNVSSQMNKLSCGASSIIISLPVPKQSLPPKRYFAYLELLSDTPRPTLLIRGNNETVLSYHS